MLKKVNYRKGMPTVTVVVGLVATLLVGSAILGSLQSIKTGSLDPNVDRTQSQLDLVGEKTATIGQGVGSQTAREEMQGLIVHNMLSASDCRIMAATHMITSTVVAEEGQQLSEENLDEDIELEINNGEKFTTSGRKAFKFDHDLWHELTANEGNGYTGRFNDFQKLINTDYDTSCLGADSAIKKARDAVKEKGNTIASKYGDFLVTATGGAVAATACVATAGVGCAAVAAGGGAVSYLAAEATDAGDAVGDVIIPGAKKDMAAEPGQDMEGKFGKAQFDIEQSFLMGTEGVDQNYGEGIKPLLGLSFKFEKPKNTVGFWRGWRLSYLLPPDLEPDTFNRNVYHRIYDPGPVREEGEYDCSGQTNDQCEEVDARGYKDGDSWINSRDFWNGATPKNVPGSTEERQKMQLYAFRPEMENVPIVAGKELSDDVLTEGCELDSTSGIDETDEGDNCVREVLRLRNLLSNSKYLFCKGASGSIQSNAGHINNGGDYSSEQGEIDDQVYPKVKITDGAAGCISTNTEGNIPESDEIEGFSCEEPKDIISDESREIFSRQKVNGNTQTASVECGAEPGYTADLGDYGNVDYYKVDEAVQGCETGAYDLTAKAEAGGEQISDSDEQIVLNKDGGQSWIHNYDASYNNDQEENSISNNQLTYETVNMAYESDQDKINAYKIELEGSNFLEEFTDGDRLTTVKRTFIIEQDGNIVTVREITPSLISLLPSTIKSSQRVFTGSISDGETQLRIDRINGQMTLNGNTVASFKDHFDDIGLNKIEISPVRNPDKYNQKNDWNGGDAEIVRIGQGPSLDQIDPVQGTEQDLKIKEVTVDGKPRVCANRFDDE